MVVEMTLNKFATEAEASWVCSTCGPIKAYYTHYGDYWMKSLCECQRQDAEKKRKAKERAEMMKSMEVDTFRWLGTQWSDMDLLNKTFQNFNDQYQPQAAEMVKDFIQSLEASTLVLYGIYGTGKTHLLAAACNALRLQGKKSRFTTAPNLFGAIQAKISHNEDYNWLVNVASGTPLLVLDDIDKARYSEFREEIYFAIIDNRVKRGLPTAISTNRLDNLSDFVGGAVASRLSIGQIPVEMNGQDYRKLL